MQCEQCNEREAKVHVTMIVMDKSATRHLCPDCAKEYAPSPKEIQPDPWQVFRGFVELDSQIIEKRILSNDKRYAADAYIFVRFGIMKAVARAETGHHSHEPQHVSGPEVLDALREFAVRKFGTDAKATLNGWGIFKCEDFGEIVFNLVNAGMVGKQDEDSKEKFANGYDFDFAFPTESP
jgi:uncharacterized repeat protein (TIGR04138 family)